MEKSLTKNSIFYLVYNVLNVVFPFITGIYVARILIAADIGQVETARNLAQYFVVFSFLGIPTYGVREISKARSNQSELNKLYNELMAINTISTAIFFILYIIVIFAVPAYRENIIIFLITGIAIALNFINNNWLFEGLEKFDYISIRNLIFKFISLILLLIFVRDTDDYLVYAFITVVGTAGNYILNIIGSRKYVNINFSNLNLKRHMKPIIYLLVVNLAIEIYSLIDITMLGLMCEKEVVTYYSYGVKIQKILLHVINTFTIVLVPRIALYYKEKNFIEYNELLSKTLSIIIVLSLPIIIGIYFLANQTITMIYGNNYIRSAEVLKILSLAVFISPIGYLLGSRVMLVTGHENKMIFAVGMGAIVNVLGNAMLIPIFQESGAAVASIASEVIVAVVYLIMSHTFFKLNKIILIKSIKNVILANCLMALVLYLTGFIKISFHFLIIFQFLCAVFVYFAFMIIVKDTTVYNVWSKVITKLCLYKKSNWGLYDVEKGRTNH